MNIFYAIEDGIRGKSGSCHKLKGGQVALAHWLDLRSKSDSGGVRRNLKLGEPARFPRFRGRAPLRFGKERLFI